MNAGEFRWRIDILEFVKVKRNEYAWLAKETVWAKMEQQATRSIYSKQGVTSKSVRFTVNSTPGITLHNAIALAPPETGHFFLADIDRETPGFDVLSAAVAEPVTCRVERTRTVKGEKNRPEDKKLTPLTFPGYLTEKYLRQMQDEPMSYSEARYVLITPKAIEIGANELVKIGNVFYEAVIPHTLDPYKNEYEILRRSDG